MRLGVDFGTTNSVMVLAGPTGDARTMRFGFEGHAPDEACRTLLCLWLESDQGRSVLRDAVGPAAIDAYLDDPSETRLIMSMKSYLAQSSFRETRLLGRSMTLEALVARFLATLTRAAGLDPATVAVTVGRPVRFAGDRPDDRLGAERLRAGFALAGFPHVQLALEPEAAGWRFMQRLEAPTTVLVGDFGGGTSDFSVMRFEPGRDRPVTPLGHAGVGIAGDQFDSRIIDRVVSPLLGRDGTYSIMGGAALPMPAEWYSSLARWHLLSLMRAPQRLRAIEEVARNPSVTGTLRRQLHQLRDLIEAQQGPSLYRAVGAAKAELSRAEQATLRFEHDDLRIEQTITRREFEAWIAPDLARIDEAIGHAVSEAGLQDDGIDRVFLTGGSAFVPAVRGLFERRYGAERIAGGGEFVSVAEGLALMGLDGPRT